MNALTTTASRMAYSQLVAQEPVTVTEGLRRWLRSSLNVTAMIRTEGRFPEDGAAYSVAVGCDLDGMSLARRTEAVDRVQAGMVPATAKDAASWVGALYAATAHAKGDKAALTVVLDLYTGCLMRWPADVAKHACINLALAQRAGPTWFPTLGEVEGECNRLGSPRRVLLDALQNWTPPEPQQSAAAQLLGSADKARAEAKALWLKIPMSYRMENPRSQWSGEYSELADRSDELNEEARDLEEEARTGKRKARATTRPFEEPIG